MSHMGHLNKVRIIL